ncbi:MAG: L,D-transpeptidase family protein [Candidatus Magnetominusculus sp. LBB02]|nr:L,D-transpeptidase family protein [Candidatus Magnetominusculus sp. LBB02]
MRKLIMLTLLFTAAFCLSQAFAETLTVAVDNITVYRDHDQHSAPAFQLYRGMEIISDSRVKEADVTWVRFDVHGNSFWAVEKDGSAEAQLSSYKARSYSCEDGDKKIAVDKKLRTLTILERDESGWKPLKQYPIGLGKDTAVRASTRKITRPHAYLTLKGNGKFSLLETTGSAMTTTGEAVIALDRDAKTLTLYHRGKTEEKDPQIFPYGQTITVGDYVVKFASDKFHIIFNKYMYPKTKKFDRLTPEGVYHVVRVNPVSRFGVNPQTHRALPSLQLSYPNAFDAWDALRYGVISIREYNRIISAALNMKMPPQDTKMGSLIMIHGGGSDDWTAGCIALEDEDMCALLDEVGLHTCVEIR